MEFAFTQNQILQIQLISAAKHGIGQIKYAFNALLTGFSTQMESVSQFQTNVNHQMPVEPVSHVMSDMT
jgi:hypothetical protein